MTAVNALHVPKDCLVLSNSILDVRVIFGREGLHYPYIEEAAKEWCKAFRNLKLQIYSS